MKYSAFKSINYYLRSWKVTAVNTDKLEKYRLYKNLWCTGSKGGYVILTVCTLQYQPELPKRLTVVKLIIKAGVQTYYITLEITLHWKLHCTTDDNFPIFCMH
jgi:hypothetical protein